MKRVLLIGGIVAVLLLVGCCAGAPLVSYLVRGKTIYTDIYVDNATAGDVIVEFDGEDWGVVVAGAYQKYDGKKMKPGNHTIVIRRAADRSELERSTELIENHGPWVFNVQGAQTYLQISDYDLHAKEKFDIRDGHRKKWFRSEYGFTMVYDQQAFGLFTYSPTATHTVRWSQIPESRRAKPDANPKN